MTIKVKNYKQPKFLQEGGQMEAPAQAAPAEGGGQDPMAQLLEAAAQAVQTQDGQLALQVCQALVEMAGGGQPAPEQEPVYRRGGKLVRFQSKN